MPTPTMREGMQYQARIPEYQGPKPDGREQDERRAGMPGPTTLEALALAASYEKQASERLHIDAIADPEYHPGAGRCFFARICKSAVVSRRDQQVLLKSSQKSRPPHGHRVSIRMVLSPAHLRCLRIFYQRLGPYYCNSEYTFGPLLCHRA